MAQDLRVGSRRTGLAGRAAAWRRRRILQRICAGSMRVPGLRVLMGASRTRTATRGSGSGASAVPPWLSDRCLLLRRRQASVGPQGKAITERQGGARLRDRCVAYYSVVWPAIVASSESMNVATGRQLERNHPDLRGDRLHRQADRENGGRARGPPDPRGTQSRKGRSRRRTFRICRLGRSIFATPPDRRWDSRGRVRPLRRRPFSATARPMAEPACAIASTTSTSPGKSMCSSARRAGRRSEGLGRDAAARRRLRCRAERLPCGSSQAPSADADDLKLYLSIGTNLSRGPPRPWSRDSRPARGSAKGRLVAPRFGGVGIVRLRRGEEPITSQLGRCRHGVLLTGIPNIEVHFEASPAIVALTRSPAFVNSFLGRGFMQGLLKSQLDRLPEGPSESGAGDRTCRVGWRGAQREGRGVRSRLTTPEGYALTAATAFDAAQRVAAGEVKPGFQTPSLAFGPD